MGCQGGCEREVVGVRVDVNTMFEVWGDVGYGGCEPSRKYCTMYKKVLYNIKKIKKNVGEGGNI